MMRDDGDEMAGMMDARKVGAARYGDQQAVTVAARGAEVHLELSATCPAGLTPAQARFIARALYRMARLAEQRAGAVAAMDARTSEAAA